MSQVAIVGGRKKQWKDPVAIRGLVFSYIENLPKDTVIISGDSPGGGVDAWAREAAEAVGHGFIGCPPVVPKDCTRYEFIKACRDRNQLMVDTSDEVVAFLAPHSRGTVDTILRCQQAGRKLTIIRPEHGDQTTLWPTWFGMIGLRP